MATDENTPLPPPPTKASAKVAVVSASVEHWARTKGMLPEFTEGEVSPARLKRAPKSAKPLIHNKRFAAFSAAKNSLKWDPTKWPTMTEAEFDEAVKAASAHAYH